jgi:UPF0755 protein
MHVPITMRRLIIALGSVLILIAALVVSWFINAAWLSSPDAGLPVEVVIERGLGFRQVRDVLAERGLVAPYAYGVYARLDSSATRPQAGTYMFRRGTSYREIARTLAFGQPRDEVSVRIIEGKTLEDESRVLLGFGVPPEVFFARVGKPRNAVEFDRTLEKDYPFLAGIPKGASLEGYLFPDTYRAWKDDLPDAVIRKQLDEFGEKVIGPFTEQQKKSGMTWHEIVTLASVVEAEVRSPADRKIVAGIFLNRIKVGMRLQSDATVNYVVGEGRDRSTYGDLQIESPYNTYRVDGLPAGPINNPSLSSIAAVLDPAATSYYFFLTDKQGKVYYGRNGAEHQANRAKAYGE